MSMSSSRLRRTVVLPPLSVVSRATAASAHELEVVISHRNIRCD